MKILVCGLGSIGKRHVSTLRTHGDFEFVALRSGVTGKGNSENVEEIFDAKEIPHYKFDGALITNPTSEHIRTALQVAGYGIPLFIEKPLDKNLELADELEDLVVKNGVPVLIGYNMLYHPAIEKMIEMIRENAIGKIIAAKSQFGTYMPAWHKDEDYRESYAAKASLGGGVVLTSIHEQNYLTEMFGEAVEVMAMRTGGNVLGIDSEEGSEIIMRHSSGVVSNIHLNFFQRPYTRTCQLIGSEGTIFWDFMIPELTLFTNGKLTKINLGSDYVELLNTSYRNQMRHFIEVIEGKASTGVPLSSGIRDMRVALDILKQIRKN